MELSLINTTRDIINICKKYNFKIFNLIDNLILLKNNNNYMIIDENTLKINNYLFEDSIYNFNGYNYMIQNIDFINNNSVILEYIEGQKILMFNYKNKWYLVQNNKVLMENSLIYTLIFSQISKDINKMNENAIYLFIYLDSSNIEIINYSNKFGNKYKKIVYLYYVYKNNRYFNFKFTNNNIIYPKKYNNISEIKLEENNFEFSSEPNNKGIIVFINDPNNTILKLQNFKYQFYKANGPEKHIFNGFIDLYQKDKLKNFMKNNKNHNRFNKIINPYNSIEVFDTKGCIDSLFKNIGNELFNTYKKFYNIKNKKTIYHPHYKFFPIYYKKILIFGCKNNFNNSYDFYKYLKNIKIKQFLEIVKSRKLFNNWITLNNEDFSYLYYKNNKLRNKLAAVYVSKLFPEIIKTETNYRR